MNPKIKADPKIKAAFLIGSYIGFLIVIMLLGGKQRALSKQLKQERDTRIATDEKIVLVLERLADITGLKPKE